MSAARCAGDDPGAKPSPAGRTRGRHRSPARLASYRLLLAVSEYRTLTEAQLLAYLGEQIAVVTVVITVFARTGSPLVTALACALAYLPPIAGRALLASLGAVVPPRRLLITADLLRAGLLLAMAVPGLPLAAVCTLLFAASLLGPPHSAARSALLAQLLPPGVFPLGAAVSNVTYQASQAVGFATGSVLAGTLGIGGTLTAAAVLFGLSASLTACGTTARPALPSAPPQPFRLSLREGACVVFSRPDLRALLLFGWLAGFAVVPEALAAPYARTLGGGPFTVGLLMSAMPVGMMGGALALGRLASPLARLRLIGWLAVLSCAPLALTVLGPPLWALWPLWALAGAGSAYQLAAAPAFARALPPGARGQSFAMAQTGLLTTQGTAVIIAGAAAAHAGPQPVVAFAGLLGVCAAGLVAAQWSRHRRDSSAAAADAPDAVNG